MTARSTLRFVLACLCTCLALASASSVLASDEPQCTDQPYQQRPFAAADLIKSPTNFLRCESGTYALCYYSGADPLPCTVDGDNADCQCQVFTASPEEPMYVDINSILDVCAYQEAVEECGASGELCRNLCTSPIEYSDLENPTRRQEAITAGIAEACVSPEIAEVHDPPEATVCRYISDGTFNPAAQVISTFSFSQVYIPGGFDRASIFRLGSNDDTGAYAGCMTAPCSGTTETTDGTETHTYTTCSCPIFAREGQQVTFQWGRSCCPDGPAGNCDLDSDGSQVWSAASSGLFQPPGEPADCPSLPGDS